MRSCRKEKGSFWCENRCPWVLSFTSLQKNLRRFRLGQRNMQPKMKPSRLSLLILVWSTQSVRKKHRKSIKCHASAFGTSRMPVPHKKYVCNNCWEGGHHRQFCQQIGQTDILKAKSVVKKPLPSGIPMVNFVQIDDGENVEKNHLLRQRRQFVCLSKTT